MANIKYFAELNGEAVELSNVGYYGRNTFLGFAFDGSKVQATRTVEYKAQPSCHECDDRCKFARGKVMKCECACGGKNHGRF